MKSPVHALSFCSGTDGGTAGYAVNVNDSHGTPRDADQFAYAYDRSSR